jgi:hypothetical protein
VLSAVFTKTQHLKSKTAEVVSGISVELILHFLVALSNAVKPNCQATLHTDLRQCLQRLIFAKS